MEKGLLKSLSRNLQYYCKKNQGLFSMNPKVAVKDNTTLALVYTPGVAKACKEIDKDPKNSLVYTNKANSILLVTDSSGFLQKDKDWKNQYAIPILETNCIYYKNAANIDAYPMVLDLNLIKSDEDVFECMKQLTAAYSGFELIGVKAERVDSLLKKAKENEFKALLYTHHQRELVSNKLGKKFPSAFISACILRAALDLHVTSAISNDCIDYISSKLQSEEANIYQIAGKISRLAADFFISQKLSTQKVAAEEVEEKLLRYYIEGARSWISDIPEDYFALKHSNDENSLELHRRYRGVCEIHSKLAPKDMLELNNLCSDKQVEEIVELCKKR